MLDLPRLEALNLRGNQLRAVTGLEQMRGLRYLDLCDNPLEAFAPPPGAGGLEHVFLSGNEKLATPPPEIVARGRYAIRDYFREREISGTERVLEAKMLILGEGGAGKTSLLRRLKGEPMPGETESTHGIDIRDYTFQTKNAETFKINVWDFGGQEIYHATHQFFLTKRALYILVADTRKEDTDFNY